jgi:hypothetical protein
MLRFLNNNVIWYKLYFCLNLGATICSNTIRNAGKNYIDIEGIL